MASSTRESVFAVDSRDNLVVDPEGGRFSLASYLRLIGPAVPTSPSRTYHLSDIRYKEFVKTMHMEGIFCLVGAALLAVVSGQFLPQFIQPPPIQQSLTFNQPQVGPSRSLTTAPSQSLVHRDVLINSQAESQLPSHLLNPFYKNARVAEALAKESWFGPGEMLVNERETQKIPRTNIFSMLKNAGLARRRR